jgi:hypothetical protein
LSTGKLLANIGGGGEFLYTAPPKANTFLVPIHRHPGVIQNDQDVRVSVCERRGVSHLGGIKLKVEGKAKAPEQPKTPPPRVRPAQVGTVHVGLFGIRMPIYGVANSTNVLVAGVTFQDLFDVRGI